MSDKKNKWDDEPILEILPGKQEESQPDNWMDKYGETKPNDKDKDKNRG